MSEFRDVYKFQAKCIRQTSMALLVEIEDVPGQHWIPQSQIDDRSEVYKLDDEGTLWISEWIAEQKGLV